MPFPFGVERIPRHRPHPGPPGGGNVPVYPRMALRETAAGALPFKLSPLFNDNLAVKGGASLSGEVERRKVPRQATLTGEGLEADEGMAAGFVETR